jgi:hypothetical protein
MWEGGKLVYVHRSRYEKEYGKIQPGMVLHPTCQSTGCINPAHFEKITRVKLLQRYDIHENHRYRQKNTCPKGHVYDGVNAVQRTCSTCRREAKLRYREKQKK